MTAEHSATEENKKKTIFGWVLPKLILIAKRVVNALGADFHYAGPDVRDYPTYKSLDKLLNYGEIAALNGLQVETEGKWDGARGTRWAHDNTQHYRSIILDYYTASKDEKSDINDSLGPYTNKAQLIAEGKGAATGTGIRVGADWLKITLADGTKIPTITDPNGRRDRFWFSLPAHRPIIYYDGRADPEMNMAFGRNESIAYEVAFFGYRNPAYWDQLIKDVTKICEEVRDTLLTNVRDTEKRENIVQNTKIIQKKIVSLIDRLHKRTINFENDHRSKLIGQDGVIKFFNLLKAPFSDITKLKLADDQVLFIHTYFVVRPTKIIENRDTNGNVTGVSIIKLEDEMRLLGERAPFWKRDEEEEFGCDENGWPLEVADGHTSFNKRVIPRGTVLLDLFENELIRMRIEEIDDILTNRPPTIQGEKDELQREKREQQDKIRTRIRRVPDEYIEELDKLEIAYYIYVNYDAYRDDIRDGRHHNKSISVMDRIMVELGLNRDPEISHQGTIDSLNRGIQTPFVMKHNAPHGPAANERTATISGKIEPSQWNPAFDLRVYDRRWSGKTINKKKTRHVGRKFYYTFQDDMNIPPYPHITTRGAAMYILHRVIEETKYWEKGPNGEPGVIDLLQAIGEKTAGYDIGPNMGPAQVDPETHEETEPGWGQPLTKNPFKPKRY